MTILTDIWRFQCDPDGTSDPPVQVFLKKTVVVDGETFIKQDSNAVMIKFSDLTGATFIPANVVPVAITKAALIPKMLIP